MTARMFDYPATPNERAVTRRNNERHQLAMFESSCPECDGIGWFEDEGGRFPCDLCGDNTPPHGIPRPCPVCAGEHAEADCPHGTAPTFPETHNPSNPAQVRAMFRSLGWPTTES